MHTRRRNRANGNIIKAEQDCLYIHVTESYGNCPKYIQVCTALLTHSGLPWHCLFAIQCMPCKSSKLVSRPKHVATPSLVRTSPLYEQSFWGQRHALPCKCCLAIRATRYQSAKSGHQGRSSMNPDCFHFCLSESAAMLPVALQARRLYIHFPEAGTAPGFSTQAEHSSTGPLQPAQADLIQRADTFFIATHHEAEADDPVSIRSGKLARGLTACHSHRHDCLDRSFPHRLSVRHACMHAQPASSTGMRSGCRLEV